MSAATAGKKRRRRWWLLAIVIAIVAAAVAGGAWWLTGRDTQGKVQYLTATARTGTISQTVSADFTLASDGGVSAISLSGGSSSSSSSTSSSSADGAVSDSGETQAATVYAAFAVDSAPPLPSPTSTATEEPTATPTPSGSPTVLPTPTPSGSSVPYPTPSQSSGGSFSAGSGSSGGLAAGGASTSSGTATASTSVSSGLSGIVTHLWTKEGTEPHTLQRLLTVSGKGVFAFVSPTPLWKDLSTGLTSGEQKANVAVLQRALEDEGYYDGKVSGTFTSATKTAFKEWQGDNGMSKTGVLDVDRFVWMPDGSTLSSWNVSLGSRVGGGMELASISAPTALLATALVGQGDLGELRVGQTAQMTIDGYTDDAFAGVITSISDEPASSSSSMGSSSSSGSTQYTITIRSEDLPDVARSGMTGTLEIVLEEHADVLLVPTSAVTGTSSTSYVRVMQNGAPVVRQVETGMATSSSTEIVSGVVEGETVVTGTYTPGASSSTSGTSGDGSRSGLGNVLNGGGMPAGPPPQGMPVPGGSQ